MLPMSTLSTKYLTGTAKTSGPISETGTALEVSPSGLDFGFTSTAGEDEGGSTSMGMSKGTAARTGESTAEVSPGGSSGKGVDAAGTGEDGILDQPDREDK